MTFLEVSRFRQPRDALKQSNEELETAYEEIQSTNEELETTNEELHAANDELRRRGHELNHVNAFLGSILSSMPEGVIVLNAEFGGLAWNHKSEDF